MDPMGARSFNEVGKTFALILIQWFWKKLHLRFRSRGEAGRGWDGV